MARFLGVSWRLTSAPLSRRAVRPTHTDRRGEDVAVAPECCPYAEPRRAQVVLHLCRSPLLFGQVVYFALAFVYRSSKFPFRKCILGQFYTAIFLYSADEVCCSP